MRVLEGGKYILYIIHFLDPLNVVLSLFVLVQLLLQGLTKPEEITFDFLIEKERLVIRS